MKEPDENIGYFCPEHAPKPGGFTDYPPTTFVGHFVKKSFIALTGQIEHMWVFITHIAEDDPNELIGQLDNDPVYPMQLKCKDVVSVYVHEIEDVLSGGSKL